MPDAYHVISIPVKCFACLALAQELCRCAGVNAFRCPGEGTISETALWRAPRVFVLQTAFWKCQPQELTSSKSHGSHVLILYFLYVRNFAIFLEFAFLNLPLGPSDQVVLRFNAFKFKCVCVKILFLQPWKSYNELFRRCSRYQEPQLLELFASSAMRIAYDCAKKRFRAQFLCVLSRAAEAEARRNDSCVRGSWQKAGLRDLGGDLTDGSVESVELFIYLSVYLTI